MDETELAMKLWYRGISTWKYPPMFFTSSKSEKFTEIYVIYLDTHNNTRKVSLGLFLNKKLAETLGNYQNVIQNYSDIIHRHFMEEYYL